MANSVPGQDEQFSDFLPTIARGDVDRELTAQLRELVIEMQRVAENAGGKPKGKISLTIGFTLDRGVFEVDPRISVTKPSPIRARTVMYGTTDGRLTRQDERQGSFALESGAVKDGVPDVRDIRTANQTR